MKLNLNGNLDFWKVIQIGKHNLNNPIRPEAIEADIAFLQGQEGENWGKVIEDTETAYIIQNGRKRSERVTYYSTPKPVN